MGRACTHLPGALSTQGLPMAPTLGGQTHPTHVPEALMTGHLPTWEWGTPIRMGPCERLLWQQGMKLGAPPKPQEEGLCSRVFSGMQSPQAGLEWLDLEVHLPSTGQVCVSPPLPQPAPGPQASLLTPGEQGWVLGPDEGLGWQPGGLRLRLLDHKTHTLQHQEGSQ